METEICHNCKREVPQQNYLMHVAHCARNMSVCPVCGDAVPKAHLKEHRIKEHALIECPACRNKVQAGAMNQHRATSCGRRTVACEFCELELPKDDLVEHELYCGARTERCEDCGELVMHKYRKLHLDSNHGFLKLNDEPGPSPSWEIQRQTQNQNQNENENDNSTVIERVPLKSKKLDEENGFVTPSQPPRDAPRTFVPAYDASDDLRAKVKLARHDLNNIKNTYLCQGDERIRQLQHQTSQLPRGPDLLATNRQPRSRFTTNLLPYEKNKSFKVNALDDEERSVVLGIIPQPLTPLGPASPSTRNPGGFFNYLGGREESNIPVVPLSKITTNNNNNTTTTTKSTSKNSTGAVPRTTRKKGPAPPIPNNSNNENENEKKRGEDILSLPCEFCGKMIAADFLVQHQTGCRPDLARLKINKTQTTTFHVNNDNDNNVANGNASEVQLPCEFCSNLYPMSKLLSHQALCDI